MNIQHATRKFLAIGLSMVGLGLSGVAAAAGTSFAQPQLVREYSLQVPQKRVDATLAKVRALEFSGVAVAQGYDWDSVESKLNRYPQYLGRVEGYDLPFYYIRGEGRSPAVKLIAPGRPGAITEILARVDTLTYPSQHGGKAVDAVSVIVPALPGAGFSLMPGQPVQIAETARVWNALVTEVVGQPRYSIEAAGIGAEIAAEMARAYPQSVIATIDGGQEPEVQVASGEALLTDVMLHLFNQAGMEQNLQLRPAPLARNDGDFWPTFIAKPVRLARPTMVAVKRPLAGGSDIQLVSLGHSTPAAR